MENYRIAGLGARALAFVIDWHVRILLCILIIAVEYFLVENFNIKSMEVLLLPLLIYCCYHPFIELAMRGSSIGKSLVGLRVIYEHDARPVNNSQIIIRNLFRVIDGFPGIYSLCVLYMLFSGKNKRLGDLAAKTQVVYI